MRRTVALGAAGAAIAAAAVGGVAFAADSGGSTTPTASSPAAAPPSSGPHAKAGHHRRALAARALHGTFTVQRTTGPAVVDMQRGQVTRSDAGSLTVHSTDGFEATYVVNDSTRVRKDKKAATTSDVAVGKKV